MRIIYIKFLTSVNVPALHNSLKDYSNTICIAFKDNSSASVHVITKSKEVVDFLFEVNPNCVEIKNTDGFINKEIHQHILTNPRLLQNSN